MSKTKKIATAVVSIILASAMCVSFAACGDDDGGSNDSTSTSSTSGSGSGTGADLTVSTDADGNLSYNSSTTLDLNVGYQNSGQYGFITYTSTGLSGSVTLLDGKTYSGSSLKPAWSALQDQLGCTLNDAFTNLSSSAQIESNTSTLSNYTMVTASADTIVTTGLADTSLYLDLSQYLDYMPNYKAFLESNPVTYMSLTSSTSTGAMYYAPYYDGNDDIEKYVLMKQNWVSAILDEDTPTANTVTFATQVSAKSSDTTVDGTNSGLTGSSSSVTSYMGTQGSWTVDSATFKTDGTTDSIVTITVDYDDVLTSAKTSGSALNTALKANNYLDDTAISNLESGNIVDLQNAVIDASSGAVEGGQLTDILKAYIDVAYQDSNGSKYYSTRSDVFNASDAAWDVDLYVALMRCVVTYGNANLGTSTPTSLLYGVTGRQATTQRNTDLASLAGELYGVRGLTSRYQYTYIDENGDIIDARTQEETYDALNLMHAMVQEGLVNTSGNQGNGTNSYYTSGGVEALSGYDYVQTQTANGGYVMDGRTTNSGVESDYNFAPVNTPVSLWDDGDDTTTANSDGVIYDYDNNGNKYMRFTESWRSVKDTGVCIIRANVANDSQKLAAALAFIDYFYSNDGQILMTFGPQSSTNCVSSTTGISSSSTVTSTDDGWWYNEEATDVNLTDVAEQVEGSTQYSVKDEYKAQYFVYQNKVYTGTYYKGEMTPTITGANESFYYGATVKYGTDGTGITQGNNGFKDSWAYALSYTNYARAYIGSCLPIGVKDQSFEYQCTASCGIAGADVVGENLTNGTISHVYQDPDNAKGTWYLEVCTTIPYTTRQATYIKNNFATLTGTIFMNSSSSSSTNFFVDLIYYGYGSAKALSYCGLSSLPSSAAACITMVNSYGMNTFQGYMTTAWSEIYDYYYSDLKAATSAD